MEVDRWGKLTGLWRRSGRFAGMVVVWIEWVAL